MVDGNLTEQQLGLQQAEERLYRDYIHRLVKVRADFLLPWHHQKLPSMRYAYFARNPAQTPSLTSPDVLCEHVRGPLV